MARIVPAFDNFETMEATVDADEHGIATATVSYYASTVQETHRLLRSGLVCPLIQAGLMRSARFLHGSASLSDTVWKVNLVWRGASSRIRLNESAVPNYLPNASTEPIAAHPNFEAFAGTSSEDAVNGAIFDSNGSFIRFAAQLEGGARNPKGGISSFYQASLSVTEARVMAADQVQQKSSMYAVGKIDTPDVDGLIEIEYTYPGVDNPKRNFLLMEVEIEDLGDGFAAVNRKWDMSGPMGWDEDIYKYNDNEE